MGGSQQFTLPREVPVRGAAGDPGDQCGIVHRRRGAIRDKLARRSNQGIKGAALLAGASDVGIRS